MLKVFIPGNVPSSKNSRQWTGKFFIASKTTRNYIKTSESHWLKMKDIVKSHIDHLIKPITISFKFIRGSKHKFDYINPCQTVQDLMVRYGWIPDDNADIIIPAFEPYEYDKKNPGVYITIH